ncbi:hypothetical protein PR202_ga08172 [Eleusine coracana subsp. coracana]|uniref:HTH myb-type domain-containing protein n=1 Tax=Eleusine coracana subsp. coracana TaxID=191504 RepID=A0AAV5C0M8_ELECO|nr:hypothetical protein QOZ80_1AG0048170 [Eleusine coracana subsp. coracana]GJM91762.1 hypothetical protein PR202_ga08172 [Eleusine coracana subsp. coracana]
MGEVAAVFEVEDELVGDDDEEEVEEDRVMEWETGLPGSDELTPLSQPLVPPGLAAAFRISPEPGRTLLDVHRASAATVSRLRRASSSSSASSFPTFLQSQKSQKSQSGGGGGAREAGKEEAEKESNTNTNTSNSNTKRPRLVWTPQLHKRFVDVVAHLGIKNAVPKTIMQLMNVEGLTRENVASHLQKYRLYVKRMQGLSNEGPSPSDHIFASTPVPQALVHEVPAPPPSYGVGVAVAVGMLPMNHHHHHHHSNNGAYSNGGAASYHYHHHHHHANK